jgi:hypothetical protein
MKVIIKGFFEMITGINAVAGNKGFNQVIILNVPGYKDPLERFVVKDDYFQVRIFDQKENSQKFIPFEMKDSIGELTMNLKGSRYTVKDKVGWNYSNNLELISWKVIGQRTKADGVQQELQPGDVGQAPGDAGEVPLGDDGMPF